MVSRNPAAPPVVDAQLNKLCKRLERWRKTRKHRDRIPERIWKTAVKLAADRGLHRTARILRVNYYALRKRLEAAGGAKLQTLSTGFVELVPSALGTPVHECVVEFEGRRGGRMKIHLKGTTAPDLAALSNAFWRAQP